MKQLTMFLDLYDDPYKALNYCAGQCNYGGRVTDDKDRRCLVTILAEYFLPAILEDGYTLNKSGTYKMPKDGTHVSKFKSERAACIAYMESTVVDISIRRERASRIWKAL